MSQLIAKNLCLGYDGIPVSQHINFQVNKGDYLCIVGENGSGKSTLVKTLAGLTRPISGELIRGADLSSDQIGYLPQQTPVQKDFPASVMEIVLSGCQSSSGIRAFYSNEHKAIAKANMERLGIYELKSSCYRNLSGGQQQRVLLARALCATHRMLLLDEPVTGLDPAASSEMYQILDDLNKTDHITIIMVSHDIEAAVKYASHILHMGSSLQFFGSKEDYVKSPLRAAFRRPEGIAELARLVDEDLCSRAVVSNRKRRYFR